MTGNDLLVYIWYPEEQSGLWIPIGCTKSHEIQHEGDMQEVSSPSSGSAKEYIPGRTGWIINTNYLVLQNSQVRDILMVNQRFKLSFCPRNAQASGVSGFAYMKVCKITSTRGNLIQGTFQFLGDGELS